MLKISKNSITFFSHRNKIVDKTGKKVEKMNFSYQSIASIIGAGLLIGYQIKTQIFNSGVSISTEEELIEN